MRTPIRSAAALAIAITIGTGIVSGPTLAQDDGSSAVCPLAPLTVPLWDGTPAAVIAATPVSAASGDIDEAEIEAAVVDLVACMNTGEPQLMFAIYTSRFIASQYADPSETYLPEFEQRLAENAPEPADQFELAGVSEISPLDDGRVSVKVGLANGGTVFEDTLILANQDGVWLIDDIASLNPPA